MLGLGKQLNYSFMKPRCLLLEKGRAKNGYLVLTYQFYCQINAILNYKKRMALDWNVEIDTSEWSVSRGPFTQAQFLLVLPKNNVIDRVGQLQRCCCPAPKASKHGTNVKSDRYLSIFTSTCECCCCNRNNARNTNTTDANHGSVYYGYDQGNKKFILNVRKVNTFIKI